MLQNYQKLLDEGKLNDKKISKPNEDQEDEDNKTMKVQFKKPLSKNQNQKPTKESKPSTFKNQNSSSDSDNRMTKAKIMSEDIQNKHSNKKNEKEVPLTEELKRPKGKEKESNKKGAIVSPKQQIPRTNELAENSSEDEEIKKISKPTKKPKRLLNEIDDKEVSSDSDDKVTGKEKQEKASKKEKPEQKEKPSKEEKPGKKEKLQIEEKKKNLSDSDSDGKTLTKTKPQNKQKKKLFNDLDSSDQNSDEEKDGASMQPLKQAQIQASIRGPKFPTEVSEYVTQKYLSLYDQILKKTVNVTTSSPFTIGRDKNNSFRIDKDMVSSSQCEIVIMDDRAMLFDKESLNGTFIKLQTLKPYLIRKGMVLEMGRSLFTFEKLGSKKGFLMKGLDGKLNGKNIKEFVIGDKSNKIFIIGKNEGNLPLQDEDLENEHGIIISNEDCYYIMPLQSQNGLIFFFFK